MQHDLEDEDIVDVVVRRPDGTTYEERIDFESLVVIDGTPYLHHNIYRPDHCTDLIPLEGVIEIKLVKARRDRDPGELRLDRN